MFHVSRIFDAAISRRRALASGVGVALTGFLDRRSAGADEPPANQPIVSNGGNEPFPIPWLDKNGNHNQPAGPDLEPSHVYHFKGRAARCAGFTGMGTDNQGNRIGFGTKTTDYGFMDGEYFAARAPQTATLTHI